MSEAASPTKSPFPHSHGSGDVKVSLGRLGVILGVAAAIAALFGAWFVLPYRVGQAEEKIKAVETEQRQQREILIRIDENVKELRRSGRRSSSTEP